MANVKNIILALVLLINAADAFALSKPLFVIRRSKNANEVHYDVNIGPDGKIDPQKPVEAYWVLLAKNGGREELGAFDKLGYGFKCSYDDNVKAYRLVVKGFKKKDIKVVESPDGVSAVTDINGKPAYLSDIYINETEMIPFPIVHYLELTGKDAATGGKVVEKIIVHHLPKILRK